jgi:hypothetical protein
MSTYHLYVLAKGVLTYQPLPNYEKQVVFPDGSLRGPGDFVQFLISDEPDLTIERFRQLAAEEGK